MADDQGSGVDPRFNPAFQRGFVSDGHLDEYAPVAGAVPAAAAPEPDAPLVGAPGPAGPTGPAAAEQFVRMDADGTDAASPASEVQSARNPYLITLLVVALVLIVAGIWLFVGSETQFDSSEVQSQGDYVSLTSLIEFAPFLALLGGSIIVGVLFVYALRYRRRS